MDPPIGHLGLAERKQKRYLRVAKIIDLNQREDE